MINLPKTYLLSFLVLAAISFASCVDEISNDQQEAREAAQDIFNAKSSFDNGFDNMNESAQQQGDLNGILDDDADDRTCAGVSFSATPDVFFPALLTLDFGEGCDHKGHNISGKMVATFDGFLFEVNKSMAIDFQQYTVDGYSLNGEYKLTNLGNDANDQWTTRHDINNGSMTGPNGGMVSYMGTSTQTQIEGQGTNWFTNGLAGITDDVWLEVGSAVYVNALGISYELTTIEPQRKPVTCQYPVSGVVEITSANLSDVILVDFGNGQCDNKATVTYGLVSFEIYL